MPATSKLLDVNVLAVYLVEDHPGNPYVSPVVDDGLDGKYNLLVPDQMPLRVRWVLTTRWDIPKPEADRTVRSFLDQPRVHYVGARRETLVRAYALADALRHDVYDTFYLALAEEHGATAFITTDAGFRRLCPRVGIDYDNPVPAGILKRFGARGGR